MRRLHLDTNYLVQEYGAGRTCKDLARELGVGAQTITRRLRDAGAEIRPPGPRRVELDATEVLRMFSDGIGVAGIAKAFGCAPTCVANLLRKRGVEPRNRGEQQAARMARATPEEIARLTRAAHEASRGRKRPAEEAHRIAVSRHRTLSKVSPTEARLADMLRERGLETEPQIPIGPYNCDIAARPVAVEVWGGNWHWHGAHLARTEERFRHIMDAGWHILVVAVTRSSPLTDPVADYVAAFVDAARRDPSITREYRVVWRAGQHATGGRADDDKVSVEPPFTGTRDPVTGRYSTVPRKAGEMSRRPRSRIDGELL